MLKTEIELRIYDRQNGFDSRENADVLQTNKTQGNLFYVSLYFYSTPNFFERVHSRLYVRVSPSGVGVYITACNEFVLTNNATRRNNLHFISFQYFASYCLPEMKTRLEVSEM